MRIDQKDKVELVGNLTDLFVRLEGCSRSDCLACQEIVSKIIRVGELLQLELGEIDKLIPRRLKKEK